MSRAAAGGRGRTVAARDAADPTGARLDAGGLAALAEAAMAGPAQGDARPRRGPFRPEVWLNARQRNAARLAPHYFRAIDVLAVTAVTLLCAWSVSPVALAFANVGLVLPLALGAALVCGLLKAADLYGFPRGGVALHLLKVAAAAGAGAGLALLTGLVLGAPRSAMAGYAVWGGLMLAGLNALHMGWCDLIERWRASGALKPNIVLVGATRHAERLIREALGRRDLNVLGVFDDRLSRAPDSVHGVPVLGAAGDLIGHKMTPFVDRVVLAIDPTAQARVKELTARLSTLPNDVTLLVDPRGEDETNAALEQLARAPLARVGGTVDPDRRAFAKRMQDMIVGLIALILLAPVMAAAAIAIRLDSPGPVFFRQRRHGFNQEEIVVWKFRSMRTEAADATASRQVVDGDDRVTRIGRILRSTSLDELPQLLNVLMGEMSLVGPRPHAIGMKTGAVESARLVAEYAHRHRIKPGMTGWAAIHGSRGPLHSARDVRRRVRLDIEYVERQSLWLDLWIMAATVPVLLGDRLATR